MGPPRFMYSRASTHETHIGRPRSRWKDQSNFKTSNETSRHQVFVDEEVGGDLKFKLQEP